MEDAPGRYVVVHKSLVVTAGSTRNSGVVARLSAGALVHILEVETQDGGQRVRGHVEQPAGWVTLIDLERGIRGAAPADKVSPQDLPRPSEGGLGGQRGSPDTPGATASASGMSAPPPSLVSAPPLPSLPSSSAPSTAGRGAGPGRGAGGRAVPGAGAGREAERARRVEAEARQLAADVAELQAELEATRARCLELQARWADMSGSSDDSLQAADKSRRQASLLRRALDEKGSRLAAFEEELEQLSAEKDQAEQEHAELEAAFRDRLQREVGGKEQQLLQEKAELKQAGEAAERRVHELTGEKAFLEQRVLNRAASDAASGNGGSGEGKHEAMLEAHMSIAHAFGSTSMEHPCLRLADEPTLKFTILLLKNPLVRRVFFGFTSSIWLFAIRSVFLQQGGSPPIHV
mmetsp:Transcript_50107/g.141990  ORF Transcript_50107/g.141990 Transcript_50107/m.141990 type:complete len:405 (+) Transcript_50107:66-1280(+)